MTILWKFKNCSIVGGLWYGGIRNCKTFFIGQFGTFIFVACGREMRSLWYFIFYMSEISIFNFNDCFWDFTKFPSGNRNRVKFPEMTRKNVCNFSLLSSNSNVKFPHMNRNLFFRENETYAILCRVCVSDGKEWQGGQHGSPNVVKGEDDEVSTSDGKRVQHDKNLLFQYSPPMAAKLFMACSFFTLCFCSLNFIEN